MNVHFMSNRLDWGTPNEIFEPLDKEFGFTLDPCATPENAKCEKFYTPDDDGLSRSWADEVVFMNPPYGREIGKWIKKAYEESCQSVVVCLIPSRTDTAWWHDYCMKADEIRFLRGRVRFVGGSSSAPFPSAIVVFRPSRFRLTPLQADAAGSAQAEQLELPAVPLNPVS